MMPLPERSTSSGSGIVVFAAEEQIQ